MNRSGSSQPPPLLDPSQRYLYVEQELQDEIAQLTHRINELENSVNENASYQTVDQTGFTSARGSAAHENSVPSSRAESSVSWPSRALSASRNVSRSSAAHHHTPVDMSGLSQWSCEFYDRPDMASDRLGDYQPSGAQSHGRDYEQGVARHSDYQPSGAQSRGRDYEYEQGVARRSDCQPSRAQSRGGDNEYEQGVAHHGVPSEWQPVPVPSGVPLGENEHYPNDNGSFVDHGVPSEWRPVPVPSGVPWRPVPVPSGVPQGRSGYYNLTGTGQSFLDRDRCVPSVSRAGGAVGHSYCMDTNFHQYGGNFQTEEPVHGHVLSTPRSGGIPSYDQFQCQPRQYSTPVGQYHSGSVFDNSNQQFQLNRSLIVQEKNAKLMYLQTIQPVKFSGSPKDFPSFEKRIYDTLDSCGTLTDSEKVEFLPKFLSGEALAKLETMRGRSYRSIMVALKENFGHPAKVARCFIQDLTTGEQLKPQDRAKLSDFSDLLNSAVETLSGAYLVQAGCGPNLEAIVNRLPNYMCSDWEKKVEGIVGERGAPNLQDVANFVHRHARIKNNPFYQVSHAEKSDGKGRTPPGHSGSSVGGGGGRSKMFSGATELGGSTGTGRSGDGQAKACKCCGETGHPIWTCSEFLSKDPSERFPVVQNHALCFVCLQEGHSSRECDKRTYGRISCLRCPNPHNKLLRCYRKQNQNTSDTGKGVSKDEVKDHDPGVSDTKTNVNREKAEDANPVDSIASASCKVTTGGSGDYLMTVIPVLVHGKNGKSVSTYAFLDTGSRASFIDEQLAGELGLDGPLVTKMLSTVCSKSKQKFKKVEFTVSNIHSGYSVLVKQDTYVMLGVDLCDQISGKMPVGLNLQEYPHLKNIHIPPVERKGVPILIGLPIAEAHEVLHYYKGSPGEPYGVETRLGVTVVGPLGDIGPTLACRLLNVVKPSLTESGDGGLVQAMHKFSAMEDFGTVYAENMALSGVDQKAMEMFNKTLVQRPDGHYQCRLLWKDPNCKLQCNRTTAERRFKSLEAKFERDPEFESMYKTAMQENITNGWASLIPDREVAERGPRTFYVSHFGVTNPNKPGKVRPVFDLREKSRGVALNDLLHSGPDSTSSLVGVLLRARIGKVCVTSDIKSMFNQCYVAEEDRDSLRFLWYHDGVVKDYRMNVHVFGAADSPCVANSILRRLAMDHGKDYDPDVVQAVKSNFYVDDSLISEASTQDAVRVAKGLKSLLAHGGFALVKFASNDREVLKQMDEPDLAQPELCLDFDQCLPEGRALGIKWDLQADSLGFKIKIVDKPHTMRGMLSTTARVFDPLGYASPVILQARLLLRQCWERSLDWDEPLPEPILSQWMDWKLDLPSLENLKISRPFFSALDTCKNLGSNLQLHAFADSSMYATGCSVYLRAEAGTEIHVALVFGKAKLLPKKPNLTIPRAELKAAVDAVRICKMLKSELQLLDISDDRVFYWSDSEITLKYIKNETTTYHVFVANRQSEIREFTKPWQWRFCPGVLNPSDDASRGVKPSDYVSDHRFLTGPEFLRKDPSEWPHSEIDLELPDNDPEVKVMKIEVGIDISVENRVLDYVKSRSSWTLVRKVVARIIRLADAIREKRKVNGAETVSAEELEQSELRIVTMVQRIHYGGEIQKSKEGHSGRWSDSHVGSLSPFLDSDGVLRVGGRLRNAENLVYAVKHPAIMPNPKDDRVSAMIIEHHHRSMAHAGQELLMGTLRERFWIVHARSFIRGIIHACILCRKRNAQPVQQVMGEIPVDRLQFYKPSFTYTGTDLFGPIMVKEKRRLLKNYGVIFLCMTTAAIHIELVKSLSTDDMIMAIQRFVSLRGGTKHIRSDNGSNYVGAERELRELVDAWDKEKMTGVMAVDGIDWTFQVPYGSSQSGYWERRVKEAKRHLYAILGKSEPDPDVVRTTLYEVSNIMNQAPLCPVSNDPECYEALTPAHFMFGKSAAVLTPVPTDSQCVYKTKWRQIQQMADSFWRRFLRDFVPTLLPRKKWRQLRRNLQVGDLVVVFNPDLPRSRWHLGRVAELFPGRDGNVRSASVQTKDGLYRRPIQKLGLIAESEK